MSSKIPCSCLSCLAMTTTPTPSNDSELQLFRVLQRANLLSYYATFIAQGGDDVQQLCEAGEEEFLEIMALVGMASKPLHVRRLQKALQEYVQNPCMFQIPLTAVGPTPTTPRPINLSAHSSPQPMITIGNSGWAQVNSHMTPRDLNEASSQSQSSDGNLMCPYPQTPVLLDSQIQRLAEAAEGLIKNLPKYEPKQQNSKKRICKELENLMNMPEEDTRRMDEIRKYAAIYGRFDAKRKPEKPLTLHEVSVNEAAAQICRHIPALLTRRDELFPLARQVVRDSGYQYSKGHSSLRASSPRLGAWNWWPGLTVSTKIFDEDGTKRLRLDHSFKREYDENSAKMVHAELQKIKRQCGCFNCGLVVQERMNAINMELKQIQLQQDHCKEQIHAAREVENYDLIHELQAELERWTTQQLQLMTEQSDIIKKQKRFYLSKNNNSKASASSDTDKLDSTDNDSHYSSCSVSSPSPSHDESHDSLPAQSELKMQEMFNIRPSKKSAQLTRQLVQETLMDEGLRVVKELASQIKEEHEDNNNDNSMSNDIRDMRTTTESTINALLSLSQPKSDIRSPDHSD